MGAQGGGLSAKFSAKFSMEWEVTTTQSSTRKTEIQVTVPVTIPEGKTSVFWQRLGRAAMYNSSGDIIASADYAFNDTRKYDV